MSGIPAGAGQLLGKRLGKYEILALLALGGTAEIYLARIGGAAGFEKFVVVKCLHDHLADDMEFVKMFLDEARLAAHLDHSNIVQTMELGEHEHRYYMVMEFLAGLSLAMVVRRAGERLPGGRLPVPLTLNIIAQSCAGLHYAHEKAMNGKALNIVHRDISPQNLVVSFEGVVKVVDFGIAKAELRETQTRSGTIKGKFAYMSPEQCVAANVDRRTDIFALGVIAHELLTGKRLFKKPSPYETYQAVIECNVDAPSKLNHELDPAVDAIVMKALAKDKERRYQTAEAFGDALLGYLHHRAKSSGPNDVARFFDTSFAQEIEEHGARMRELINGRDVGVAGGWSEEDEAEAKRKERETMDLELGASGARPSSKALDEVVSGLRGGSQTKTADDDDDLDPSDDDDMPAEKTRIESNPLELLQQALAATPAKPAAPTAPVIPRITPPVAVPAQQPTVVAPIPTPQPMAAQPAPRVTPQPIKVPSVLSPPMTGPLRLPEPPMAGGGAPMRPSGPLPAEKAPNVPSGRFPDSANMATQMAPLPASDDNEETKEAARAFPDSYGQHAGGSGEIEGGETTVRPSGHIGNAGGAYGVHASGMLAIEPGLASTQMAVPLDLSKVPRTASPNAATGLDLAPHPNQPIAGPLSGVLANQPMPQVRPSVPSLASYPVMDARMSAAMASGADVFPDAPSGRIARPSPGQPDSGGYPASGAVRGPDSGQLVRPPDSGQHFDHQRAVDLASPVGGNYPQQDWDAAAAMPAKALTPVQLALIFVGALGAAMLVIFIIARIAHH